MRVRFSPPLAAQAGVGDGEVHLSEALEAHQVLLILYTLFPGLLAGAPGRAGREVIDRHVQLWRNGEPIGLADQLRDKDVLLLTDKGG